MRADMERPGNYREVATCYNCRHQLGILSHCSLRTAKYTEPKEGDFELYFDFQKARNAWMYMCQAEDTHVCDYHEYV